MRRAICSNTIISVVLAAAGLTACDPAPPPRDVAMGERSTALAMADLNGDGRDDLITASSVEREGGEPEQLLVRLSKGDAEFGELQRNAGPYLAEHLAAVDLNQDANVDLVAITRYAQVQTYTGDGTGQLVPSGSYFAGCERAIGGVAAQLDGDANVDVAVLCREEAGPYLQVLLGTADGRFVLGEGYTRQAIRISPSAIDVADLNGDGARDLVLSGTYDGQPSLVVHLNDGAGFFGVPSAVPGGAEAVRLGDFDADGHTDAMSAGDTLYLHEGGPAGVLTLGRAVLPGPAFTGLEVADLDRNGRLDVLAVGASGLSVLLGQPSGKFSQIDHALSTSPTYDLALGDVDADERVDAAVLAHDTPPALVRVFENATLLSR